MNSPHGLVHKEPDHGTPVEARMYHPGVFPVLGESETATGREYSTPKTKRDCCLLQNPASWLLDCEARVEQCLGMLPLGMSILSSFAADPRSYGSV